MLPRPQEHDLDALAAFAERRLDGSARARVIEHLASCGQCRETLAAITRAGLGSKQARPAWRGVPVWAGLVASIALVTFAWMQWRPSSTPAGEELLVRRAADRIVKGKTFRMESDTWIDSAFDPRSGAPTVLVRGTDERTLLAMQNPELAEFSDLGPRVIVVWDGKVYRFEP
jgi:hypothetical protein